MNIKTEVTIIGGGIAGLSIARQLKLEMPALKITLLEKNSFPLPEAAIKVGESTVEMGAHYYANILGLKRHLEREQLFKLGLRYFFPFEENSDITQRFEMGSAQLPTPVPTYQIDRGRFENHLYQLNKASNVFILDQCKVKDVQISNRENESHSVTYLHDGELHILETTWIIDASGRYGLLKRKLRLEKPVNHDSCAAWFRIKYPIDINTWSDDPMWQSRSPLKQRRFSTNHFMGRGYWVWIIPLASGSTSIGIVYDPKLYEFKNFKDFDTTLHWLKKHEPQIWQHLSTLTDKIQDFRWLKNYAYSCKQLYSNNRWYITGEAGVFADPFYSPGNDFIALGNTYITDLIIRDKKNEDTSNRIVEYNKAYLNYFNILLSHFEDHYENFGIANLMIQKILWDTICAFGVPYLLFYHKKFCDLKFMKTIGNKTMAQYKGLTYKVQHHFKKNANTYKHTKLENNYLNFSDIIHSNYYGGRIYRQLTRKLDDKALTKELESNILLMENLSEDILANKKIVPDFYINGEGNTKELWRLTRSQITIASENNWHYGE